MNKLLLAGIALVPMMLSAVDVPVCGGGKVALRQKQSCQIKLPELAGAKWVAKVGDGKAKFVRITFRTERPVTKKVKGKPAHKAAAVRVITIRALKPGAGNVVLSQQKGKKIISEHVVVVNVAKK